MAATDDDQYTGDGRVAGDGRADGGTRTMAARGRWPHADDGRVRETAGRGRWPRGGTRTMGGEVQTYLPRVKA